MATEQVNAAHAVDAVDGAEGAAWRWNRQRLALAVAASIALLALIALVAVIDLPQRDDQQADSGQGGEFGEGGFGDGPFGQGLDGGGRIDLGDGSELTIRPIPGCPGGFELGDDMLIIPDPEACGYQRVPPGAQGFDPSGKTILVPDVDGDVGGFRIGPDGEIGLVPPGELGDDDFAIGQFSDGTFGLFRPDGTWLEIVPGDDGLSLRDPLGGDSFFIPGDGSEFGSGFGNEPGAQNDPNGQDPSQQLEGFDQDDRDRDNDSSFGKTWLWVLLAIVGAVVIGLIAKALSGGTATKDESDEGDAESVQDTVVDYTAELNALDRMLWEIDQEPDPRMAINRVYAALETGLGNPDMARGRSETPGIYLRRILGRFDELHAPLSDLTDLFQKARFSEHEITPEMRDWAVHTLVGVRGHFAQAAAQAAAAQPANA